MLRLAKEYLPDSVSRCGELEAKMTEPIAQQKATREEMSGDNRELIVISDDEEEEI